MYLHFDSRVCQRVNRVEAVIGSDILRELSRKIDNKKRQLPVMGNWRDKNNHYYTELHGTIMPMQCYTCPEEEQCFFLTDVDHVSFEKANETRQNNLQSATVSLQVVIGLCKRKETAALISQNRR